MGYSEYSHVVALRRDERLALVLDRPERAACVSTAGVRRECRVSVLNRYIDVHTHVRIACACEFACVCAHTLRRRA